MNCFETPPQIYHYLVFRAQQECIPFGLTVEYIWRRLILGTTYFYGVITNTLGSVLADTNYPGLLVQFKQR